MEMRCGDAAYEVFCNRNTGLYAVGTQGSVKVCVLNGLRKKWMLGSFSATHTISF